jgi:hypothetical protein
VEISCTNFLSGEKAKEPCGLSFPPIFSINSRYSIKVQELTALSQTRSLFPCTGNFNVKYLFRQGH